MGQAGRWLWWVGLQLKWLEGELKGKRRAQDRICERDLFSVLSFSMFNLSCHTNKKQVTVITVTGLKPLPEIFLKTWRHNA